MKNLNWENYKISWDMQKSFLYLCIIVEFAFLNVEINNIYPILKLQ